MVRFFVVSKTVVADGGWALLSVERAKDALQTVSTDAWEDLY